MTENSNYLFWLPCTAYADTILIKKKWLGEKTPHIWKHYPQQCGHWNMQYESHL